MQVFGWYFEELVLGCEPSIFLLMCFIPLFLHVNESYVLNWPLSLDRNHIHQSFFSKKLFISPLVWRQVYGSLLLKIDCGWSMRRWHRLKFLGNFQVSPRLDYLNSWLITHHKKKGFLFIIFKDLLASLNCLVDEWGSCITNKYPEYAAFLELRSNRISLHQSFC